MSEARPVLVTGASGFVGSAIARALVEHGIETFGLSRRTRQTETGGIRWVQGDIRETSPLEATLRHCGTVINVAGRTGLPADDAEAAEFFAINRDAVAALAATARQAGVNRFIHISSTGVFGPGEGDFDEESPCRPANVYEQSKLAGEHALRAMGGPPMEIAVIRPSNVFGERHPWHKLLTWMRAVKRGRALLAGDPEAYQVNYLYVGDVAETLCRLVRHPRPLPPCLILNTPVSVHAFFEATTAAVGGPGSGYRTLPAALLRGAARLLEGVARRTGRSSPLTCEKVAELTGTQVFRSRQTLLDTLGFPPLGLEAGLARTAAWYREAGLL